jgi:hypothetical protein
LHYYGMFSAYLVMFPVNRVHVAHPTEWNIIKPLLRMTKDKDADVMVIKFIVKQPWESDEIATRLYTTRYEPCLTLTEFEKSLWYALSQSITSIVIPGALRFRLLE